MYTVQYLPLGREATGLAGWPWPLHLNFHCVGQINEIRHKEHSQRKEMYCR